MGAVRRFIEAARFIKIYNISAARTNSNGNRGSP
jgi:hypothetical protein